jgi:hypothetical protein
MGLEGVDPAQIIEQMSWTGNLPFASRDEMGNQILLPGQKPVEFTPSQVDPALERFAILWTAELDKVKEILGMNSAVDASSPDKRLGLGVQELAANAYRTSIRALQNSYLNGIKKIAERAAYFQQLAIKEGTVTDEIRDLLSDPEFELLKTKEISELMFNVEIELLPSQQEREQVLQDVQVAIQQGVIGLDDALMVRRALDKSIEKAEELLRYNIEKTKREAQKQKEAEQQMLMQQEQMKAEQEARAKAFDAESEMNIEEAKKLLERENKALEEEERRKTLSLEYELKMELLKEDARLKALYDKSVADTEMAPKIAGRIEPSTQVSTRIQ